MTVALNRDIGSYLRAIPAVAYTQVLAGGAADGVPQNGIVIDRNDYDQLYLSALLAFQVTTASLGPATATVEVSISDSADGVIFAAWDAGPADTVYSTDGDFVISHNVNFAGARRYVRVNWEITMSAGSVDTADVTAVLVAGGFDELPTSATQVGS